MSNSTAVRTRTPLNAIEQLCADTMDPEQLTSNLVTMEKDRKGKYLPETGKVISIPAQDKYREMVLLKPLLYTGAEWRNMAMDIRIDVAIAMMLPSGTITCLEMLDVFPGSVQAYLAFWQRELLTGDIWWEPWRVGRTASDLVERGFLLHSRRRLKDFYGNELPTRYNAKQGEIGTDAFVKKMMGARYLEWIKAIKS